MANSNYTFSQVVNGTGYFSKSQDTGYSAGVKDLQTYLKNIGYTINDTSGRFQTGTENAVKKFQGELGTDVDGSAGPGTCKRLNAVRDSIYFKTYGKPLTSSEWGRTNILAGKVGDVDLLARIILAESGYQNLTDQKGVAIVLRNRYDNGGSKYVATTSEAPKASKWARVVGKSGGYGTTSTSTADAMTPKRGYYGKEADGFIDPGWKNAVDRALDIYNSRKVSVTGYKVSGTAVLTSSLTVNSADDKDYLNQIAWSSYKSYQSSGGVDTSVQPLTFKSTSGGNVICKIFA